MEKIDCRLLTKRALANELNKILNNYMRVYDEYYSTGSIVMKSQDKWEIELIDINNLK